MFEQRKALQKIEYWAEKLPYKSLRIEVELPDQTLTLCKTKARPIGFVNTQETEVKKHGCT